MTILGEDDILRIHEAAVAVGLTSQRAALLVGSLAEFAGGMGTTSEPNAQLLIDLHVMNQVEQLGDGAIPLEVWLGRAGALVGVRKERSTFKEMQALVQAWRQPANMPAPHATPDGLERAAAVSPSAAAASAQLTGSLVDVRAAYRTLHAYHRRLFNLLQQVHDAVERHIEPLPKSYWGSYHWDSVPKEMGGFLDRWVFDFMPLQHAYFGWSPSKAPKSGSFYVEICHGGDDAVDNDPRTAEPNPATFPPVEVSKTTLTATVRAIVETNAAVEIVSWAKIEDLVERLPGHRETIWKDGAVHTVVALGTAIRYGGFDLDMGRLGSSEDVDRLLVQPLLALIREAKRS